MNTTLAGGIVLSVVGIAAYVAGVFVPYPGRGFSVTAVMVGLTLVAIGRSLDPADTDGDATDPAGHGDGEGSA